MDLKRLGRLDENAFKNVAARDPFVTLKIEDFAVRGVQLHFLTVFELSRGIYVKRILLRLARAWWKSDNNERFSANFGNVPITVLGPSLNCVTVILAIS